VNCCWDKTAEPNGQTGLLICSPQFSPRRSVEPLWADGLTMNILIGTGEDWTRVLSRLALINNISESKAILPYDGDQPPMASLPCYRFAPPATIRKRKL
jgi:hypothetical protein